MADLLKIAVTGPESCGKSVMAKSLADHYSTIWVPEYARSYLQELNRPYHYDDILEIARGQHYLEQVAQAQANRLLFADTELTVTKIWCDVAYQKCHPWIEENLAQQDYRLYLLMDVDLPWEYDPLREHPHMRSELMNLYVEEMEKQGFNYQVISGVGAVRLENAIEAVEAELKKDKLK